MVREEGNSFWNNNEKQYKSVFKNESFFECFSSFWF